MDNLLVVNTDNALQVLQDKILYHIDAYINNLHNPDDIYNRHSKQYMESI